MTRLHDLVSMLRFVLSSLSDVVLVCFFCAHHLSEYVNVVPFARAVFCLFVNQMLKGELMFEFIVSGPGECCLVRLVMTSRFVDEPTVCCEGSIDQKQM